MERAHDDSTSTWVKKLGLIRTFSFETSGSAVAEGPRDAPRPGDSFVAKTA